MSNTDTDALVRRLRGDAQGEDLGADGMGWSPDPTLKREAADTIERLTRERDEAVAREPDREAAIKAITDKWRTRQFGQHAGYLDATEIVDIVLYAAILNTQTTT